MEFHGYFCCRRRRLRRRLLFSTLLAIAIAAQVYKHRVNKRHAADAATKIERYDQEEEEENTN